MITSKDLIEKFALEGLTARRLQELETVGVLMGQVGALGLPSSLETLVDRVSSMDQAQLELVFATAWYQSVSDSKW